MEQNRPEPRRTLPPAQRRRRHRIRLVRNWTVFLLSCGAVMAVMTGGILWLLPRAYALIAPPTTFEAREYEGGAETDLSDKRLMLVNANLPLTEEPTPELAVAVSRRAGNAKWMLMRQRLNFCAASYERWTPGAIWVRFNVLSSFCVISFVPAPDTLPARGPRHGWRGRCPCPHTASATARTPCRWRPDAPAANAG